MSHDGWIAGDMLYVEHGEVFGLLPDLRTVRVGTEAEVMAALEEPSKHRDMVRRLALVGVEIGVKEKDDGRDQISRGGMDRRSTVRIPRHKKGSARQTSATTGIPLRQGNA